MKTKLALIAVLFCASLGFAQTVPPVSVTANPGQTVTITATADGTQPMTLQWFRAGVPITGATASPLILASVKPTDAGDYTATFTNPAGSATTPTATLIVRSPPVVTSLTGTVK